ncbi:MAG: hypothetical protein RLZZ387_642 [Chloroflexota bacterium]|jgi:peroxiredoxin
MTHTIRYALAAAVLIAGSAFIWATRVQPVVPLQGEAPAAPPAAASADPAPLPDHPAPDFTLAALDGSEVRLASLRGQVVLVNVWATWCPPCRAEMPAIQATYDEYRGQGFTVLAVNFKEDARTVAAYLEEHRLTFPALLDVDGSVGSVYQARGLPSSFFVDRRGVIRAVYRGPMPRGIIEGTVAQLLQEAP